MHTDPEKIKLGNKMVKMCKGVPLSIVVLGGILRKKQTLHEWKSVHKTMKPHLIAGYDHGRSCMEIVLKSYDDLSYHLKPCFLHLANFPEDYEIKTKNLCRMWVAEGLVTRSSCDRTRGTKLLEDVANDYLCDLEQANLVQIVKKSKKRIESVRMSGLVRDVCLEKATGDNLLRTIDLRSGQDHQQNTSEHYSEKRLLRLAIYTHRERSSYSLIRDSISTKAPNYFRSLLFIPDGTGEDEGVAGCKELMRCICNELQLLRVLVLTDIGLTGRLTTRIGELVHLRYLSLRNTSVAELPSSIGKLMFLEVLDLRVGTQLVIPNTLWKLFQLTHLLFPDCRVKEFKFLRVTNLRTKDLTKIKSLRKLSIKDTVSEEAIMDIIPALKSGHLQKFVLEADGGAISEDPRILSLIICDCKLMIRGPVCLFVGTLHGVVCLFVDDYHSFLLWNPCVRKFSTIPLGVELHACIIKAWKCSGFWIDPYTKEFKIIVLLFSLLPDAEGFGRHVGVTGILYSSIKRAALPLGLELDRDWDPFPIMEIRL
ncbi:hypothetical protein V2J09_006729 [Rumex salicifolius]